jgi:starch phosphorylase
VARVVNGDRRLKGLLKLVFMPNYRVSLAEKIFPAADVSEQISTAGYEASGTSNMKFSLNGALTVGTLDGANIEIMEEVGEDNIFIFGLSAEEVDAMGKDYNPKHHYEQDPVLKKAVDLIRGGFFSPDQKDLFHPLVDGLLGDDQYRVMADFDAYHRRQMDVDALYRDRKEWVRKSILNVARIGKFSSDRTIREYNRDIWDARPLTNTKEEKTAQGPRSAP